MVIFSFKNFENFRLRYYQNLENLFVFHLKDFDFVLYFFTIIHHIYIKFYIIIKANRFLYTFLTFFDFYRFMHKNINILFVGLFLYSKRNMICLKIQSFCLFVLWLTFLLISTDCSNNYLIFFVNSFVANDTLVKKLSVVTFFLHSVNGNNVS